MVKNAAFRVRFEGSPPVNSNLYWRGPVMDEYDGLTWRAAFLDRRTPPSVEARGDIVARLVAEHCPGLVDARLAVPHIACPKRPAHRLPVIVNPPPREAFADHREQLVEAGPPPDRDIVDLALRLLADQCGEDVGLDRIGDDRQ